MNVEDTVDGGVVRALLAIRCARAVLAHAPSLVPVLAHGQFLPTRDTAGVAADRDRTAEDEGATAGTISEIVGQDHRHLERPRHIYLCTHSFLQVSLLPRCIQYHRNTVPRSHWPITSIKKITLVYIYQAASSRRYEWSRHQQGKVCEDGTVLK